MATQPRTILLAVLLGLGTLSAGVGAQTLTRLLDLNRQSTGTVNFGSDWFPLGVAPTQPPTLYFAAWTEATGRELWKTQGTPATTQIVVDFWPGPQSSNPGPIGVLPGGDIFLPMTEPATGRELRRVTSDGTTTTIADATPGVEGAEFSRPLSYNVLNYFTTQEPTVGGRHRMALKSTDGQSVTEVVSLADDDINRASYAAWRRGLLMGIGDGTHGRELWKSDGTAAGTGMVQDLEPGPGGSDPASMTEFNGSVYLSAFASSTGRELYRYDGTTLQLAADIASGAASSAPQDLFVAGNRLVFTADDGQTGREYHYVDSEGNLGTVDLNPGPAGSDPKGFVMFAGQLWLTADDGVRGREFVAFDPAAPGTPIAPLELNARGDGPSGDFLLVCGDVGFGQPRLVFSGTDGQTGDQLWSTDGTPAGTERLTDFRLGMGGARPRRPACVGGRVVFAADDDALDDELHSSDGTPAGTSRLADVNGATETTGGSAVQGFTHFRGRTYFMASDGLTGGELWETDGTEGGTRRLTDVLPGQTSLQIKEIRPLGDLLFMTANNPLTVGSEPHVFDPRTGVLSAIDIEPGRDPSFPHNVSDAVRVPGPHSAPLVFFAAHTDAHGVEPWRSDGTEAGTFMLGDLVPGSDSSHPAVFVGPVRSGGSHVVLFTVFDEDGRELWRSDGSSSGTQMVLDILPGPSSSLPRYLTVFRGVAYFQATGPAGGTELWRSDGTAAGTVQVADIYERGNSAPKYLTVFAGRLFFGARHPDTDREMWTSDGTGAGTTLFRDLLPGTADCDPRDLTVAGNRLFFTGKNDAGQRVLWVTDGSPSNTFVIPGPLTPKNLTAVGRKLYFTAGGPDPRDEEFWFSDGTIDGTRRTDVWRGPRTSGITEMRAAGGVVYVRADDGVHGNEPYVVRDTGASATPIESPCGGAGTTLAALPPELGATIDLAMEFVPGAHTAWVLIGLPTNVPLPIGNCQAPIDPSVVLVAGSFDTGAGGTASVPLPIPNRPSLIGARVVAWSLLVDNSTLDVAPSNALILQLGR